MPNEVLATHPEEQGSATGEDSSTLRIDDLIAGETDEGHPIPSDELIKIFKTIEGLPIRDEVARKEAIVWLTTTRKVLSSLDRGQTPYEEMKSKLG